MGEKTLELLIHNGAQINVQDFEGMTPLNYIFVHNPPKFEIAESYIKYGADPDTPDNDGNTVLHNLVRRDFDTLPLINFLVENGADFTLKNNRGLTPLDIARQKGKKDIVRYLEIHQLNRGKIIEYFLNIFCVASILFMTRKLK